MNKQLLAETQREIADWTGVSLTQENGGKHSRIVLHYKGESRMVVVSNTPSDARVIKNHIATVRRELRGLGATKAIVATSPHDRERNKPVRIAMPSGDAPVQPNPFEKLEHINMNANPVDAIFASIDKLRYSEMLELAQILSDVACAERLRRSSIHDWARTLHHAVSTNKAPGEQPSSRLSRFSGRPVATRANGLPAWTSTAAASPHGSIPAASLDQGHALNVEAVVELGDRK